ncbi:hypothetical protein D3C76_1877430 [compost metagenome]
MRIICAMTTRLRVSTGNSERSSTSPIPAPGARLEILGSQLSFTANTRIRM